jgi:hypothetical protein
MSILDANLPQHPCYAKTSDGFEYLEFSCIARIPQLYSDFERHYDGANVFVWMEEHPLVPIAACVLYLAAIQFGTLHFKTRDRWNWRYSWRRGMVC